MGGAILVLHVDNESSARVYGILGGEGKERKGEGRREGGGRRGKERRIGGKREGGREGKGK